MSSSQVAASMLPTCMHSSTPTSAKKGTVRTTASTTTKAPLMAAPGGKSHLTQLKASHAQEMEQDGFTLVDRAKSYAAAMRATSQRVTGRSNDTDTARRPVAAATAIRGVLTTAINKQTVIQQMLAIPQSREQHNQKLREALYKVFKVKQLPTTGKPAEPLEIKVTSMRIGNAAPRKSGHKIVPPSNQLISSRECFHCGKKGHYARQCRTRKKERKQEERTTIRTLAISNNNRFQALEQEDALDGPTSIPPSSKLPKATTLGSGLDLASPHSRPSGLLDA